MTEYTITIQRKQISWHVTFLRRDDTTKGTPIPMHKRCYGFPEVSTTDKDYMLADICDWCQNGSIPRF